MMKLNKSIITVLATLSTIVLISVSGCKHDPDTTITPDPIPEVCDTSNITYSSVKQILAQNCYSCHNDQTSNAGINLSSYSTVTFLAKNGILQGVINHEQGFNPMPQGGKLGDCDLLIINKWVNDTTFDNSGGVEHPCDSDTVYFENDILPLIVSSCGVTGCHGTEDPQEGIVLVDYASIINNGDIVPGNPDNSELYEKITETDIEDRMPPVPNDPLTSDQILKIRTWILQGAKNNRCDVECDTTNVTYTNHIWPTIENNCYGCHSGNNPSGGILLQEYNDIVSAVNSGKLWGAINHEPGFAQMPRNLPKLSDCEISAFRIWIEDNMPEN